MIEAHESNRRHWEERTPVHLPSAFYDVEGFLAGRNTLLPIEREGVGDVGGKSLLHLQCHFGLDTLSWARLGARVTGVDFSPRAVAEARELARRAGLTDASRFVCADVLELDQALDGRFDVVFTSYGAITWLCDLDRWARQVSRFLAPGGLFFLAELHPAGLTLAARAGRVEVAWDYFHDPAGVDVPPSPDYADPSFTPATPERYWAWPLADIFRSLHRAGLAVRDFREYPYSCHAQFPFLVPGPDGLWRLPPGCPSLPLLFSLAAGHA